MLGVRFAWMVLELKSLLRNMFQFRTVSQCLLHIASMENSKILEKIFNVLLSVVVTQMVL